MAYVFYPVTYMMGFEAEDCFRAARLLAIKLLTTTMVGLIRFLVTSLIWLVEINVTNSTRQRIPDRSSNRQQFTESMTAR